MKKTILGIRVREDLWPSNYSTGMSTLLFELDRTHNHLSYVRIVPVDAMMMRKGPLGQTNNSIRPPGLPSIAFSCNYRYRYSTSTSLPVPVAMMRRQRK